MPNPFKLSPEKIETTTQAVYDVYIPRRSGSGYIYGDNTYKFRSAINRPDGTPIVINGEKDFYVNLSVVNSNKEFSDVLAICENHLPSSIFADCKEGDYVSFTLNDKPITLRLNQQLYFSLVAGALPQGMFEEALAMLKRNIEAGQFKFHADNVLDLDQVDENGSPLRYIDPALKVIKPFFAGASRVIHANAVIANGNGEERKLTKEDLQKIPFIGRGNVDKLLFSAMTNDDGTVAFIRVGAIGENRLQDLNYFRQDGLLYIWKHNNKHGKEYIYDTVPEYEVLELPNMPWTDCGVRFEERPNGEMDIFPRSAPEPVLRPASPSTP